MSMPFSSARLELAVASERRAQAPSEVAADLHRPPAAPSFASPAFAAPPPPAPPAMPDLSGYRTEPSAELKPFDPPHAVAPPSMPDLPVIELHQESVMAEESFLETPAMDAPIAAEDAADLLPPAAAPEPTEDDVSEANRRLDEQPPGRVLGKVIAVNGARATISTKASVLEKVSLDAWSIGKLISINLGSSRIVGMVYEMNVQNGNWTDDGSNLLIIEVELVGEVVDNPGGKLSFRRGIAVYPWLGAPAHRIRSADLRAVFDLGDRAGVEIGRVSQDESIPAVVSMEDMLSKHFSVVGTTGVGKSSSVSLLVRKAVEVKKDLRVLVLDPHNEYAHAFRDQSITLDVNTLDLPVWLFRFDELVDVIYRGRAAPDGEADLLRELIPMAKAQFVGGAGVSTASGSLLRKQSEGLTFSLDAPSPYRMLDLLGALDDMMGKLDPRHDRYYMRVLKGRLEALISDPRYRFMFGKGATEDNLDQIIGKIFRVPHDDKRITVLQLAGLPSEVLNAVVSVLSRMSFEVAMWSAGGFEILVLCEEAHRYVPQDKNLGFAPTRQAIARIAKEGRKYGCYIGVITQRPGELDPTILSQCSTVFAMRLGNDRDQEIIRASISDSSASQISFLSAIGNREAIAFGEGVATPMRMKFTFQDKSVLPAAATAGHGPAVAGAKPQISLRSVVAKMRGQLEAGDL
jgi:uncharacterized protein